MNMDKSYISRILRFMVVFQFLCFAFLMFLDATGLKENIWFRREKKEKRKVWRAPVSPVLVIYIHQMACRKAQRPLKNGTKHNNVKHWEMSWKWANNQNMQWGMVTSTADNTNLAVSQEGLSYQKVNYRHVSFQKWWVTFATFRGTDISSGPWTNRGIDQGAPKLGTSRVAGMEKAALQVSSQQNALAGEVVAKSLINRQ